MQTCIYKDTNTHTHTHILKMVENTRKNETVRFHEGKFQLLSSEVSAVPAGKVLIQVSFSPINPHDHYSYEAHKEDGYGLGIEGSGIIIEVGEGVDAELVGKKASFLGFGAWTKYITVDLATVLILDPSQDL